MPAFDWDTASAGVPLVIFVVVIIAAVLASRKISSAGSSASKSLASRGVSYKDGVVSVKTDAPKVTLEDEIAAGQAKMSAGIAKAQARPEAFSTGRGRDSPRGFQRTKKLD